MISKCYCIAISKNGGTCQKNPGFTARRPDKILTPFGSVAGAISLLPNVCGQPRTRGPRGWPQFIRNTPKAGNLSEKAKLLQGSAQFLPRALPQWTALELPFRSSAQLVSPWFSWL